jgi:glutamate synthase domain-containing protein 3
MPIRTFSCWSEFSTNGKIQFGVFGGFSKNLGTDGVNGGKYYSRGSNIDFVYRVSPRMVFNLEKLRISAEMEYTTANYGKANTMGEVVDNLKAQSNIRALLAFYYFF